LNDQSGHVFVKRTWFGDDGDVVPVDAIDGVRWDNVSGGVNARQPRTSLCSYVRCDQAPGVRHSCRHGQGPHSIKVLIRKKGSDPAAYRALAERADDAARLRLESRSR
jgi:hypothetical protein